MFDLPTLQISLSFGVKKLAC